MEHLYWMAGGMAVLLIVVDFIGYVIFWSLIYRIGPRVFEKSAAELSNPGAPAGTVFETAHGVFEVVSAGSVLVRDRVRLFDHYQGFFCGAIEWQGGATARASARLRASFLIECVAAILVVLVSGSGFTSELVLVVPVIAVFIAIGISVTRSRMERLLREYGDWCATDRSCA